jgi:hypothetical protein
MDVGVAGIGEVAIGRSADEAPFALGIEPARRLTIRNYRREWSAGSLALIGTWSISLTLGSAAAALVARAPSVVVVTIVVARAARLTLLISFASTSLTHRRLIVLLLLILSGRRG